MKARGAIGEVAWAFLRLGCLAFGGPAAHIGLMRDEFVRRRRWVTEQHFLDLLGATNLIPGPNSTEMTIHLGYVRAGWPGLVLGGSLFILPAMLMVMALAWAYVRYGATPQAAWALYGVKPVVIAVVLYAVWNLGRAAVKGPLLAAGGVAVFALYLAGVNELALLFGGAIVLTLLGMGPAMLRGARPPVVLLGLPAAVAVPLAAAVVPVSLGVLFLTFLKIGAVLYGSGYVLLAFLRSDFVDRLGWITDAQLLDAISVGQFTPGPVFTAATFVGYLVGGWWGGILATVAIFLPAFVFVAVSSPIIPRLREWRWTAALLDAVNVAALGLMAAVTLELGRAAIRDPFTAALAVAALVALARTRINSAWLILGGALLGAAYRAFAG